MTPHAFFRYFFLPRSGSAAGAGAWDGAGGTVSLVPGPSGDEDALWLIWLKLLAGCSAAKKKRVFLLLFFVVGYAVPDEPGRISRPKMVRDTDSVHAPVCIQERVNGQYGG